MIDDRTLCICGHEELDHAYVKVGPYSSRYVRGTTCSGNFGTCKCTWFTPLDPFLQGD